MDLSRSGKRGIALILVLSALVLITILVLAVLASVTTFAQSSRAGSNNSSTRALADTVVQLVTAQIRDATTLDQTKAWASQPGMIRTYDNTGNQSFLYKLYSSPSLVVDGSLASYKGAALLASEAPPANWDSMPGIYTDLNSPALASDGSTTVFPIIDPRAWSGVTNPPPIPNTSWNANNTDVQGFTYSNVPPSGGSSIDGVQIPAGANDPSAKLAMPAYWLYVRKDGFITAATNNGDGTVTVPNDNYTAPPGDTSPNPNPIIGRVAFWTDDETCKVNINTACGDLWSPDTFVPVSGYSYNGNAAAYASSLTAPGSFWEVPRFSTWYDELVLSQIPLKNEFQRYPGHPSTVYLSAVFPQFSAVNGVAGTARDELYSIIPRVNGGTGNPLDGAASNSGQSTEGGTQEPAGAVTGNGYSIVPKHDRLYASIDELLYTQQRQTNPIITPAELEKAKFFITTNSESPETNLFNLPRVSMWPISSFYNASTANPTYYSSIDQLLAYCSTLGTAHYFFERNNALSSTADWSINGNPTLYAYLQNLLKKNIPGYGGSLGAKYAQTGADALGNKIVESNQILTEIMDYIRCIDLQDPLTNQYAPVISANGYVSSGMVLPLVPQNGTNTSGFGRFMTIGEVGVQFFVTSAPTGGMENVQANLIFEGHSVSGGLPVLAVNGLQMKISLLNSTNLQAGGTTFTPFSNLGTIVPFLTNLSFGTGDSTIGPSYPQSEVSASYATFNDGMYGALTGNTAGNQTWSTPYPWISQGTIQVPATPGTTTMQVTLPDISMQTYLNNSPIQTLLVPLSKLSGTWVAPYWPTGQTPRYPDTILPGDSLHTLVPGYPQIKAGDTHAGGDYRLLEGMVNPPSTLWVPEGNGDPVNPPSVPMQLSHNFTFPEYSGAYCSATVTGNGNSTGNTITLQNGPSFFPGYNLGTLIGVTNLLTLSPNAGLFGYGDVPCPPPSAYKNVAYRTEWTHDFDQGPGFLSDGAFINHPEEVNVANIYNGGNTPYFASGGYSGSSTGGVGGGVGSQYRKEFASPNRIVPSPGILGSLPSRLAEGIPWQTLLFRAQPEHPGSGDYSGGNNYSGQTPKNPAIAPPPVSGVGYAATKSPPFTVPPDHLFLDLFWMPVAEPYAISNTFSTSGKINLNYQIMPYTYIDRATAMKAVLRSVRMSAAPTNLYIWDKGQYPDRYLTGSSDPRIDFRRDLNLSNAPGSGGTLVQFENKFDNGDLFRSASQICDVYLVPLPNKFISTPAQGFGASGNLDQDAYNWWNTSAIPAGGIPGSYVGYKATGDNSRELPYADIYSLLTTKSNSYTVHMRVQSLKQVSASTIWSDPASGGKDVILGEYRGSASIERYLDPSDTQLQNTDFMNSANSQAGTTLSQFYRYRITSTRQFAP
jgi:uncharacterized protein (TIGR02600 family)